MDDNKKTMSQLLAEKKHDNLEDVTPDTPEEEVPDRKPDQLDLALEEFSNEYSAMTFGEKFANLRNALMWNTINMMRRIKKHGIKSPLSAEEKYKQEEAMKQFRLLERMYDSEKKAAKADGKNADEEIDKNWLRDIKNSKSTIGSIVVSMSDKK